MTLGVACSQEEVVNYMFLKAGLLPHLVSCVFVPGY